MMNEEKEIALEAVYTTLIEGRLRNKWNLTDSELHNVASWALQGLPPGYYRVGHGPIKPEDDFACACTGFCSRYNKVEGY